MTFAALRRGGWEGGGGVGARAFLEIAAGGNL